MIDKFRGKYEFLSNFYPCQITHDGFKYPSTEHAYQASKTLDFKVRKVIAGLDTPGKAKRYGRHALLRDDWESVKDSVMREVLSIKFLSHSDLAKKLVLTGDEELIEGNTWGDTYWGVCNGIGENVLGNLLMEIREVLRGLYETRN